MRSWNQHPRLVVATCLALAACASSSDGARPAWVESRRHQQYPDGAYLIGVGTVVARDRDAAYQQSRDRAIADIAGFYEQQVDQTLDNLSSIIEPVLILMLGGMVGGIALAVITPIFALTQSISEG